MKIRTSQNRWIKQWTNNKTLFTSDSILNSFINREIWWHPLAIGWIYPQMRFKTLIINPYNNISWGYWIRRVPFHPPRRIQSTARPAIRMGAQWRGSLTRAKRLINAGIATSTGFMFYCVQSAEIESSSV